MTRKQMGRMIAASLGALVLSAGIAFSGHEGHEAAPGMTPDEALQSLMEGNKHFVANSLTNASRANAATRASLATSQKPYAVIVTCSDSRVPPELIFDKGLGEIFVIRVAGNVPDAVVLGSIEYAVEHLGSSLVMVLGHERCGAVAATVGAKGKSTGSENIDAIVKTIEPSIETAAKECAACKGVSNCAETKKGEFVECVVDANAKRVAASLTKKSSILMHLVEEKKVKIVAAKYDLDEGTVTLFQ